MKTSTFILSLLLVGKIYAQTITPQVINSAGGHHQLGSSAIFITDNVGEPFVETVTGGSMMITQGFIQPEVISNVGFSAQVIYQSMQCIDKEDDAFISIILTAPVSNYTAQYVWSDPSYCTTGNNCSMIDSLKAGTYSVTVALRYLSNAGVLKFDTLRLDSIDILNGTTPCKIHPFNVVAINTASNKVFFIENITEFPKNRVTIFNRWGREMANITDYNNNDHAWPKPDQLGSLPATTYFYVIELGDASKPVKGWVELIKE